MATSTKRLDEKTGDREVAVPCPVCEGTQFDVILRPEEVLAEKRWLIDFYRARTGEDKDLTEFTQGESTFVVACQSCGTVLRNPRPNAGELSRRYRQDSYGDETLRHLLECERSFFRDKAERFRQRLAPGSKVLELGSFVGAFLLAAKERGWQPTGIDIGEETSAFCRSLGLSVISEDIGQVRGAYDAVFVWNTFDQIPNPRETLAKIQRLLVPGGLLVLRIPNGQFERRAEELMRLRPSSADRVRAAMAFNNFLTFPYLVGYTPHSLSRLLEEKGFRVDAVQGDTILPLNLGSDETRSEELRYKRATLRACRLTGEPVWPWLDVHATRQGD